jgi:fumarate reductase (CoM/CoB) subunit A
MIDAITVELDVLIIGGGGAGTMAAIWAAKEGASVGLIEKGIFGKAGCTVMGAYSACAAFGFANSADSPQQHFEDTVKAGQYINRQDLVEIFTWEAPERINEIITYGAKFDMAEGKLHQAMMPGHTYPRACHYDRRTGPMIMGTLARQVRNTPNIHLREEVMVLDLAMTDHGPHWVIGLRWADSQFIVFRAKAIVVATGGGAQIYKNNTTSLDNTGDGISLMFEAGAEIMDMEFVQFFPLAVCFPRLLGLGPVGTSFLRIRAEARLYNGLGKDFLAEEMPGWRFQGTRDRLSLAIYREITEGRGSPHGGIYVDVSHLPQERVQKEFAIGDYYGALLRGGVDLCKGPIEAKVAAHFFMGGARVNERGETKIPGLFAGGEAVAGYHGANRLAGNALTEILVSGSRAGKFSALWAKEPKGGWDHSETLPKEKLKKWKERISKWEKPSQGIRAIEGKGRIQEIMWENAGVIRKSEKMREGYQAVESLAEEMENRLFIQSSKKFNREILDALELGHMLRLAKLILRAAETRKESRGAHYRSDFPCPDNEHWLANIILSKSGDEMVLRKEEVKLTKLSPERPGGSFALSETGLR